MGIRLSLPGMAVFFVLGLGVLCHLCSGFLAGRFSLFGLGSGPAVGEAAVAFTSKQSFDILLRLLWC
jgi:inositol monophosphatase 3